ncbi:17351_t:CDS:2 [Funneliformis caledonium]|uniref:17351_t:CDS:1 n=1 Tax=Funneliformis caledonium TaxID=1117310 RepID=A0A9N9B7U5_9GLOM|nr:17351_t:CDS:2 [Funneliformis caledonium]
MGNVLSIVTGTSKTFHKELGIHCNAIDGHYYLRIDEPRLYLPCGDKGQTSY